MAEIKDLEGKRKRLHGYVIEQARLNGELIKRLGPDCTFDEVKAAVIKDKRAISLSQFYATKKRLGWGRTDKAAVRAAGVVDEPIQPTKQREPAVETRPMPQRSAQPQFTTRPVNSVGCDPAVADKGDEITADDLSSLANFTKYFGGLERIRLGLNTLERIKSIIN